MSNSQNTPSTTPEDQIEGLELYFVNITVPVKWRLQMTPHRIGHGIMQVIKEEVNRSKLIRTRTPNMFIESDEKVRRITILLTFRATGQNAELFVKRVEAILRGLHAVYRGVGDGEVTCSKVDIDLVPFLDTNTTPGQA